MHGLIRRDYGVNGAVDSSCMADHSLGGHGVMVSYGVQLQAKDCRVFFLLFPDV